MAAQKTMGRSRQRTSKPAHMPRVSKATPGRPRPPGPPWGNRARCAPRASENREQGAPRPTLATRTTLGARLAVGDLVQDRARPRNPQLGYG